MLDGSAARPRPAYAATGDDAPVAARPVARLGIVTGRAADLGAGLAAGGVEVTRLWGLAGVAGAPAAGWGLGVDCCVCACTQTVETTKPARCVALLSRFDNSFMHSRFAREGHD